MTEAVSSTSDEERAARLGAQPALIQQFGIRGLYGQRTLSLSSHYAATILIARNGTGKTTLLGTLDAFLKMELNRLRTLDFSEIYCRLRGISDELVLKHDDLVKFLQVPIDGEFGRLVSKTGVSQELLLPFLTSDYRAAFAEWRSDFDPKSLVSNIWRAFNHNDSQMVKACDEGLASLFARVPALDIVRRTLFSVLNNHEIVYLPTYRRVELALSDENTDRYRGSKPRPRFNVAAGGLHTGEIRFGLADISDRLSELRDEIIAKSNRGYREISENIINELITGYQVAESAELPKPDELKLFFSRLESGTRIIGPHYAISTPDFNRIYSGEGVPQDSRKFLTYFLGKLGNVIAITTEIEKPIKDFVRTCNKYLSSAEPITLVDGEIAHANLASVDLKTLTVNRNDLSVSVESIPAGRTISLDALSSGEKQMISLFARIYLYPRQKIVLIDEPELSLSLDWQRSILIDVLLSPNCEQVVAITHSPFVFDNSLESFARTLDLNTVDHGDNKETELDLGGLHG